MRPEIGQRVCFLTLLSKKEFLGHIVYISNITGDCRVKLDIQDKLVNGVLYYEESPTGEIPASHWQACFPYTNKDL